MSAAISDQENVNPIDLSRSPAKKSAPFKCNETFRVNNDQGSSRSSVRLRSSLEAIHSNAESAKKLRMENSNALAQEKQEDISNPVVFCNECNIGLTSLTSLREHELGKKHLATVKAKARGVVDSALNGILTNPVENSRVSIKSPFPKTSQFPPENDPFIRQVDSFESSLLLPHTQFCELCRVPLPDPSSIEAHIKGRKHRTHLRLMNSVDNQSCQSDSVPPSAVDPEGPTTNTFSPAKEDDCRQKFVENWVSTVNTPTVSAGSACQLDVRHVIRRICLTQIFSLLGSTGIVQSHSPLSDEQLLAMINSRCTEFLCASNCQCDSSADSSGSLVRLVQNNLLLCWCQQLRSLDN